MIAVNRQRRANGLLVPLVAIAAASAAGCVSKPEPETPPTGSGFTKAGASGLTDEEKGKVVARIGDEVITLEEFERRLNQQSPFARARYNSLERKREFLDSLIRFELLAIEAESKGYDEHPDVVLAKKQAMVKELTGQELVNLVKLDDITDAEIEAYYKEHIDQYDKPAEVRASHLLVKDEAQARALLAKIRAAIEKSPYEARDIFADFVRRHSEDAATRETGGDLHFFGKPGESRADRPPALPPVPPPVALAAWALEKVGDVAPEPVKSSQGWHLVQKTGFKRPYKRSLDEVRTSIRNRLYRQKKSEAMEAYVQRLREKAKIEIDESVLAEAKAERQVAPVPGLMPPVPGVGPRGPIPARLPRPKLKLPDPQGVAAPAGGDER